MQILRALAAALLLPLIPSQLVSAQTNFVLRLNSASDYVEVPDHNSLDLVSTFTLEAWINPARIVNREQAVISKPRSANGTGVELRTFGNGASLAVNNDEVATPGINLVVGGGDTIEANTWHHIAATYDGTMARIYVDGTLVKSHAFVLRLGNSAAPFTIGQKNPPGGPLVPSFVGLVDEARVWNRALTQQELQQNMSLRLTAGETGLVGYWNFDDQTANDRTPNKNDGRLIGTAQLLEDPLVLLQIYRAVEIFSLSGSAAGTYQLQFKTNALSTNWINLDQPFAGGQTMQFFDSTREAGQKVYRVVRVK